jgi:hypothetical protein
MTLYSANGYAPSVRPMSMEEAPEMVWRDALLPEASAISSW